MSSPGKVLPAGQKAANHTQAGLRCLSEWANAQLRQWRVSTSDFPGQPRQLTTVVKAIQALHYWIRATFGVSIVATGS